MKNLLLVLMIAILSISVVACSGTTTPSTENKDGANQQEVVTLKVGATSIPHAQVLQEVKADLEKEGINLEIVEYNDYVQPNIHLSEGQIDANYFQHVPYLESFTADRGIKNLTYVAKVHIEPMAIYSKKVTDLANVEPGSKVSVPQDPSNLGRALVLLEKAGLIKLKEGVGIKATDNDIAENAKNLEIVLLDAAMLPRALDDVTLSVINTNYALQANLNPVNDSLLIEGSDSPYANILAVRIDDKEKAAIKKLVDALTSDKVKKFIENEYKGAVVPAF